MIVKRGFPIIIFVTSVKPTKGSESVIVKNVSPNKISLSSFRNDGIENSIRLCEQLMIPKYRQRLAICAIYECNLLS